MQVIHLKLNNGLADLQTVLMKSETFEHLCEYNLMESINGLV